MKKRVLAGMRPTGNLHLGNYLGSAKGMVALQEDPNYETYYMVVDLHAMTTPYDKESLASDTLSVVLDYLAVGLDPEKSVVFVQSQVSEHTELAYYLSTVVSMAKMQHLPTFKEKAKQHPKDVTMAMLGYGVLMAADILIYKAECVPVGIDQEPHIELAREIAKKMNQEYGTGFPLPKRFTLPGGEYVPSLTGEGKMSKSVEGSYINLSDNLEAVKSRLASVPTDSGKGKEVPEEGGVSALLKLVELFEGRTKRKEYEEAYTSEGIRYSDLKDGLAEAIYEELKPIQARRKEFERDVSLAQDILREGARKASAVASGTIQEVKQKMGILKV